MRRGKDFFSVAGPGSRTLALRFSADRVADALGAARWAPTAAGERVDPQSPGASPLSSYLPSPRAGRGRTYRGNEDHEIGARCYLIFDPPSPARFTGSTRAMRLSPICSSEWLGENDPPPLHCRAQHRGRRAGYPNLLIHRAVSVPRERRAVRLGFSHGGSRAAYQTQTSKS